MRRTKATMKEIHKVDFNYVGLSETEISDEVGVSRQAVNQASVRGVRKMWQMTLPSWRARHTFIDGRWVANSHLSVEQAKNKRRGMYNVPLTSIPGYLGGRGNASKNE
jgi:hypothetical protein